jgi:thymidylate synthase (FAD)
MIMDTNIKTKVTILDTTTKNPISLMGERAGVCWGADTSDPKKNYQRGLDCIKSGHGRVMEFVNIEMVIEGYSARVIREWYTHIGGAPTRLQESTRYVDCENFDYVTPPTITKDFAREAYYRCAMSMIKQTYQKLIDDGVPKEDAAMLLPLGMTTKIVDKRNLRNLVDMSRQRMCNRAYKEYRQLFFYIRKALSEYSDEWKEVIDMLFYPKCEELGYCPEKNSCGKMSKQLDKV